MPVPPFHPAQQPMTEDELLRQQQQHPVQPAQQLPLTGEIKSFFVLRSQRLGVYLVLKEHLQCSTVEDTPITFGFPILFRRSKLV